ncbi:glycosyltransferase [Halomonas sp. NO4]|uniref:glycosyltransferase n=1 Tax=Halomonas sp. NO4 TaxID=2484813 RepID=UPI0013D7D4F8|nr:glycosyltransferase [Halomonas sp. NO4]
MIAVRKVAGILIDKAHRRGEKAIIFVRNHPALLLVGASLRHRADGFIFQSSFPLELQEKNYLERFAYRTVIRVGSFSVDGVLAVSPLGLQRAKKLCSRKASGLVVPLLTDLPAASTIEEDVWGGVTESIRFIYIGTHAPRRNLDVVMEGSVSALDSGVDAVFLFVGGKPQEINALRTISGVKEWENKGRIRFACSVPRRKLPSFLQGADVGLSLIPALPQYREASPTKLAEYMGMGLAVLASRGIELQESFVNDSSAGLLVTFDKASIAEGVTLMAKNPEYLEACKANSLLFAMERLNYSSYVEQFKRMLESNPS